MGRSSSEYDLTRDRPIALRSSPAVAVSSLPFEEIYVHFVQRARKQVATRLPSYSTNVGPAAFAALERDLLKRITGTASTATGLHFRQYIARQDPAALFVVPEAADVSRGHYYDFVDYMINAGGLDRFLDEYHVLRQLIDQLVADWTDATYELLCRLNDDLSLLAATFCPDRPIGHVADIQCNLSDRHHHGRVVLKLQFSAGIAIFYKPRDLAIDSALASILDGINQILPRARLRLPKVCNRSSYGWVESIEHIECTSGSDLREYYYRAGVLLCLAYILNATDFHHENVIASGPHPVLIDVETLLHRSIDEALYQDSSYDRRAAPLQNVSTATVVQTGLLPLWRTGADGSSYDSSGLGATEEQVTGFSRLGWESVNTDAMRPVAREVVIKPTRNRTASAAALSQFEANLLSGFTDLYMCVLADRQAWASDWGILKHLKGTSQRLVRRGTNVYAQILERLLHPEFLRSPVDRDRELDSLLKGTNYSVLPGKQDVDAELTSAECISLRRLDIPHFTCRTDSTEVVGPDDLPIKGVFETSSYEELLVRIQALGPDDLRFQTDVIKAALFCRYEKTLPSPPLAALENHRPHALYPAAEFVRIAAVIGDQIAASAFNCYSSSPVWLNCIFDHRSNRLQPRPMGESLYDGRLGLAFFLSALYKTTGSEESRELALRIVRAVRTGHTPDKAIGAGVGLGSYIYALAWCSEWLDDNSLLQDAFDCARMITEPVVALDQRLDVMGGAAGAILGLLALHAHYPDGDLLARAAACGEHLVAQRALEANGYRAWRVPGYTKSLSGFAHGAAGIAYSLACLGRLTGDRMFAEVAREAVAYENTFFISDCSNWRDLRDICSGTEAVMTAWCHGATGIGLGRLRMPACSEDSGLKRDVEAALLATQHNLTNCFDHLCCGMFGRLEFLLNAGLCLNRPELIELAQRTAAARIDEFKKRGVFNVRAKLDHQRATLGLFTGVAGIGYELLRLADARSLPSLLLFETQRFGSRFHDHGARGTV